MARRRGERRRRKDEGRKQTQNKGRSRRKKGGGEQKRGIYRAADGGDGGRKRDRSGKKQDAYSARERRAMEWVPLSFVAGQVGLVTEPEGMAPRLLDKVRELMRFKHYSIRTEEVYLNWIRRFIVFHSPLISGEEGFPVGDELSDRSRSRARTRGLRRRWRHPEELGTEEVREFLTSLAVEGKVAAATQNQALSALLFLYQQVLKKEIGWLDDVERARRPVRLPVVCTAEEVRSILSEISGTTGRLMANLLYGSGLRLMECVRLRVKDVDLAYNRITVRDGKGAKDRVTMLPVRLCEALRRHLRKVKAQHEEDLAEGFGAVYLPFALERKYANAAREWAWQYVFPSNRRSGDPRGGEKAEGGKKVRGGIMFRNRCCSGR